MQSTSRLTSKHQTTIPAEVRRVLGLRAGDSVEFAIRGKAVLLRKASPRISDELAFRVSQAHPMRDWDTPEDDEAFGGL